MARAHACNLWNKKTCATDSGCGISGKDVFRDILAIRNKININLKFIHEYQKFMFLADFIILSVFTWRKHAPYHASLSSRETLLWGRTRSTFACYMLHHDSDITRSHKRVDDTIMNRIQHHARKMAHINVTFFHVIQDKTQPM
jgi:hypothetical protein